MENTMKCDECNGTGTVEYYTDEGDYNIYYNGDCIECDGLGEIKCKKYLDDPDENE